MARLDRYHQAVENIRATGRSPGETVTVTRDPDGELDVWIRPGTLRRLTGDQIAAEIRAALLAAVADHRRQFIGVRTRHFGSPLFVTPFTPPEPLSTRPRE
ncbi:YbaB/EbfC family nucleoid-associated protein [Actinoplanes teichomyceticus]|uniref:YbaB/EbfC DNA-binding family protein n=1 Tax=Actinoplanes teichomyceticus TaxID=1867 RepID=A0A561WIC8_ACTTI|nr:YbaB/EbfC family nucleoid-associated protein [Actinoplanes teichomyceticus]TWG23613.1 hypothetical protein FHX34_102162 [Actinoplanes teichomyceticus]GIF11652.1 hypothetical protein Ate01nite_16840 [Actinoplanes teichomyceticus]